MNRPTVSVIDGDEMVLVKRQEANNFDACCMDASVLRSHVSLALRQAGYQSVPTDSLDTFADRLNTLAKDLVGYRDGYEPDGLYPPNGCEIYIPPNRLPPIDEQVRVRVRRPVFGAGYWSLAQYTGDNHWVLGSGERVVTTDAIERWWRKPR